MSSSVIVAILLFVVINFYLYASVNLPAFFYVFLLFSLITDGLFILVQLFRRRVKHANLTFDPVKVTVVIACYNGEEVIAETLTHALRHVPPQQIIVVSDASTDNTEKIVNEFGVKLLINEKNLQKVLSIDRALQHVRTPYVLLVDDDVLLGDITIPTSLLDDGYTAVAFNVMPVKNASLVNRLQVFEYRNSMQIGKNLRARSGGIGNVSGAIGLYRTDDLRVQSTLHSNQFAGEDEQRTILAHLYGVGKGITYTDEVVLTHAPDSFSSLYRQRAHSWSLALPELFVLYWKILFSPRAHYLLKAEKAYYLYIYLTDPLRILFLWVLVFRPTSILLMYGFYLLFSLLVWLRLGLKDGISVVLVYPLYKLWLTLCRFVGNFLWFKDKAKYLAKKLHKRVVQRKLLREYFVVTAVFVGLWGISLWRFSRDVNLYNKIQGSRLEAPLKDFEYEKIKDPSVNTLSESKVTIPARGIGQVPREEFLIIYVEKGDTDRAIAYKAVEQYLGSQPFSLVNYDAQMSASRILVNDLKTSGAFMSANGTVLVETSRISRALQQQESSGRSAS